MKLAIMQPYLFPYIGYYQLISAVEKFIIYDDVNFIKQGWINRNTILANGKPCLFTVPLENQSSFSKINETLIDHEKYHRWKKIFFKTIEQNYSKAPFFIEVLSIIKETFEIENNNLSLLATNSLKNVCDYIGINTSFENSSSIYLNQNLTSQNRILDICKKEDAKVYVNPIGGVKLYNENDFLTEQIALRFIKANQINYNQFNQEFVPNLSIIDVLMFNEVGIVKKLLSNWELI